MLGLGEAIDDLIALDPPGLRAPSAAPRITSEQIRADRELRRAARGTQRLEPVLPRAAARTSRTVRGRGPIEVAAPPQGIIEERAVTYRHAVIMGSALLVCVGLLTGRGLLVDADREVAPRPVAHATPSATAAPAIAPADPSNDRPREPRREPSRIALGGDPWAERTAALDALPALLETLSDPRANAASRTAAAMKLAASSHPEYERALDDLALVGDPAARVLALETFTRRASLSIQAQVVVDRALADPDPAVRAAGIRAMERIPDAASRLIPRLPGEREESVLAACFETIGRTAGPEHVATLVPYARRSAEAARAVTATCERNGLPLPEGVRRRP